VRIWWDVLDSKMDIAFIKGFCLLNLYVASWKVLDSSSQALVLPLSPLFCISSAVSSFTCAFIHLHTFTHRQLLSRAIAQLIVCLRRCPSHLLSTFLPLLARCLALCHCSCSAAAQAFPSFFRHSLSRFPCFLPLFPASLAYFLLAPHPSSSLNYSLFIFSFPLLSSCLSPPLCSPCSAALSPAFTAFFASSCLPPFVPPSSLHASLLPGALSSLFSFNTRCLWALPPS